MTISSALLPQCAQVISATFPVWMMPFECNESESAGRLMRRGNVSSALSTASLGPVLGCVRRNDANAACQSRQIDVIDGIGGSHFDSRTHFRQLQPQGVGDFVDVAGDVLTQGVALDDPGEGLQDSDSHVTAILL